MSETRGQDVRIEAVLSQLSHAANLGISPEELLTRAMDGLLQVSRAPAGVACLAGAEGKTLEVVSVRGIRPAAARTLPQAFRLDLERGSERVTRPIRIGREEFPGLEELHARLSAEGIAGGILLPLASDGRLLGLLIAMFRAGAEPPPALSDAHLDALQQEISSALQNARMRHGLQSLNLDLLRLLTLAKILGEPRELEDTLTTVAQAAKAFAGAGVTVVWLAEPAQRSLTRIVSLEAEGPDRVSPRRLAYGEGLAGWVAETGEALHLEDALNDPRLVAKDWAKSRNVRCAYVFPLRFKEALVGVLGVWTSSPLPVPQLSLLGTYSDHAALAIGHARLLRDKEISAEQLATLMAVARTINEGTPAGAKLAVISEACRRATGATWFAAWGADGRKRELHLLHTDPANKAEGRKRLRYGSGLVGWAALHRQTRIAADVRAEPLAGDLTWCRDRGIVASVTLPLIVNRKLVGVLHLGTQAPPGPELLRLMEGYAALTAAALARGRAQRKRWPRR